MFATFTGTLAGSIPSMTENHDVIFIEKEQGEHIQKLISNALRKYHQPSPDLKSLSSDCYSLLLNFSDCAASPKIQELADHVTSDMFHYGIRDGLRYLKLI